MEQIVLDFTNCDSREALHQILMDAFEFPDYYGKNLDALWDCLKFYTDEKLLVIVTGLATLPADMRDYAKKMLEVFDDVHKELPNITFQLQF